MHRHIFSHGLKESMDWFTRDIDDELRSSHPPSGEMIVMLCLATRDPRVMMDTEFMMSLLRRRNFQGAASVVAISHDPSHPFYSKVKMAFDFAQDRRKLAGYPPDPWPMQLAPKDSREEIHKTRRLIWEPTTMEIREAWRLYYRFMREGYLPYSVDSRGETLLPVGAFDPHAGELMFLQEA